jgi:hypothetical protein
MIGTPLEWDMSRRSVSLDTIRVVLAARASSRIRLSLKSGKSKTFTPGARTLPPDASAISTRSDAYRSACFPSQPSPSGVHEDPDHVGDDVGASEGELSCVVDDAEAVGEGIIRDRRRLGHERKGELPPATAATSTLMSKTTG